MPRRPKEGVGGPGPGGGNYVLTMNPADADAALRPFLPFEADPEKRAEVKRELARELHDRVAQTLTTMLVRMELVKTSRTDEWNLRCEVGLLQQSTREVLVNIRQLLSDLRDEPGVEHDFVQSVRHGLVRRFERETGIKVHLSVSRRWERTLPSPTALNLYRILQECLNNVRLHSGARQVTIRLWADADGTAELSVRDDGRGLDELANARYRGMGWLGMRERATVLGGRLTIRNSRRGGTRVRASFPRILAQAVAGSAS